jgi:hypothetical protein
MWKNHQILDGFQQAKLQTRGYVHRKKSDLSSIGYVCMCICICIYAYVYVNIYVYVYMHIYIYMYIIYIYVGCVMTFQAKTLIHVMKYPSYSVEPKSSSVWYTNNMFR